jgi:hypothetical protein
MSEQGSNNTGLIIAVVVIVIVVLVLLVCVCCGVLGFCSLLPAMEEMGTTVGALTP